MTYKDLVFIWRERAIELEIREPSEDFQERRKAEIYFKCADELAKLIVEEINNATI